MSSKLQHKNRSLECENKYQMLISQKERRKKKRERGKNVDTICQKEIKKKWRKKGQRKN